MDSSYDKRIKTLKYVQIILIVVLVSTFFYYFFKVTSPNVTGYVVKDECGPIGGRISHSINDNDGCSNACRAYCLSLQEVYSDSKFELKSEGCNTCNCFCQEE